MSTPKPPFLNQSLALMKLESNFMDFQGMSRLAGTCVTLSSVFKSPFFRTLLEQAKKAAPLLNLVLNIDENGKKEIREIIKANPEFILFKSQGRVKYWSSKQNKIIARLEINNVSPLEAAAFTGDFHLVNVLRDAPDNLKHKAGLQLAAILSRCDFLSAFHALQKAYHEYLSRHDILCKTREGNQTLTELQEHICQAQKKLSLFGLQVFCNPSSRRANRFVPDFTQEPSRDCWLETHNGDHKLDLGDHGRDDTFGMLFRGHGHCAKAELNERWVGGYLRRSEISKAVVNMDSDMINNLCKVISDELGNTKTFLLQFKQDEKSDKKSSVEEPISSLSVGSTAVAPT